MNETLTISGMTCVNCERRIKEALLNLPGVEAVDIQYSKTSVHIQYQSELVNHDIIIQTIEEMGYTVSVAGHRSYSGKIHEVAGISILILAMYMLLRHFGFLSYFNNFPTVEAGMSYGMIFIVGMLTSVHCMAMCGGINLSQSIPAGAKASRTGAALLPGLLYNMGRVISYTLIGGLAGALGSVISFSTTAKGVIQLAAGIFMILMGANMLGVFPVLRRIVPHLPASLTLKVQGYSHGNGPLIVGLLNGLMPCGPLQAMQLYALSTGHPAKGALSMLLFSLGTVPLMLGLSAFSSLMSKRFTRKMMMTGAVLVVVLGVSMFSSGLALSGLTTAPAEASGQTHIALKVVDGVQVVETMLYSGSYEPITVEAGIPVQWTIVVKQGTLNGCNSRLLVPEYGIEKQLELGENFIEFVPIESGVIPYSCWMGMIRSTITVTDGQ